MSRMPRAGGRYVQPIGTTGVLVDGDSARGSYPLTAATQYYFILGGIEAPFLSVHLTGEDAALIITSAAIQDCNHPELPGGDVTDFDPQAGRWVTEDPTTAFVGCDGTGWSATNGVLAVTGGTLGGAMWHFAETAAARHRLSVLVGATGGHVRVSVHGKM